MFWSFVLIHLKRDQFSKKSLVPWIKHFSNFDFHCICSHNPKNNTFTSVYHTPLNLTLKKPVAATGGVSHLALHFEITFKGMPWAQTPADC